MTQPVLSAARRRLCAALMGTALGAGPLKAAANSTQKRPSTAKADGPSYAGHPAAMAFAAEVAERRGWSRSWVQQQLAQARRHSTVQQLIMPPPVDVPRDWTAYRSRFVEPIRLRTGAQFWQAHEKKLHRAEAQYGVPAEIIVGIIGVETIYGRHLGNFRLIDALATLSFDFPPGRRDRSAYFRSELEELLAWVRRTGQDLGSLRGSYAGASGLPQFMPGSINRYAIDYDQDGRIDLFNSPADVIGSVAHYMAAHGWHRGMPTHHAVTPPEDPASLRRLLEPDILPSFTATQMSDLGAQLDADGRAHEGLLALVELQNGGKAPQFVAGTANFYAITRYNWSSYYAMAVIELGAALAEQRRQR